MRPFLEENAQIDCCVKKIAQVVRDTFARFAENAYFCNLDIKKKPHVHTP